LHRHLDVNARYHFHVNLLAQPAGPLTLTWEEAAGALERLPQIIFEPDGSFIASGNDSIGRWQVDGHLFDFADRLHRVELRGECPADAFDSLLRCVGWPEQSLKFEMVREGETFSELEFRERATDFV
jgi:hypothetical protein